MITTKSVGKLRTKIDILSNTAIVSINIDTFHINMKSPVLQWGYGIFSMAEIYYDS